MRPPGTTSEEGIALFVVSFAVTLVMIMLVAVGCGSGDDDLASTRATVTQRAQVAVTPPAVALHASTPAASPTHAPKRKRAGLGATHSARTTLPSPRASTHKPRPRVRHTAKPRPTHRPAPRCRPLTNSGNCYEPGEFCRAADHGASGISGDGSRITCRNNNGWRWE